MMPPMLLLVFFGTFQLIIAEENCNLGPDAKKEIMNRIEMCTDEIVFLTSNYTGPHPTNLDYLNHFRYEEKKLLVWYFSMGLCACLMDDSPDTTVSEFLHALLTKIPPDQSRVFINLDEETLLSLLPDFYVGPQITEDIRNLTRRILPKVGDNGEHLIEIYLGQSTTNIKNIIRLYNKMRQLKLSNLYIVYYVKAYVEVLLHRFIVIDINRLLLTIMYTLYSPQEYAYIDSRFVSDLGEQSGLSLMGGMSPIIVRLAPYLIEYKYDTKDHLHLGMWPKLFKNLDNSTDNHEEPESLSEISSSTWSEIYEMVGTLNETRFTDFEYGKYLSIANSFYENALLYRHDEQLENTQSVINVAKKFIHSEDGKLLWLSITASNDLDSVFMYEIIDIKVKLYHYARKMDNKLKKEMIKELLDLFTSWYKIQNKSKIKMQILGTLDPEEMFDLLSRVEALLIGIHDKLEVDYPFKNPSFNPFELFKTLYTWLDHWLDLILYEIYQMTEIEFQVYIEKHLKEVLDGFEDFASAIGNLKNLKCLHKKICLLQSRTKTRRTAAGIFALVWSITDSLNGGEIESSRLSKVIESVFTTRDCEIVFPEDCQEQISSSESKQHIEL